MIRPLLFLIILSAPNTVAQISNVRQTIENGRVVVVYDLGGAFDDLYNIALAATDDDGNTVRPKAVVGDIAHVAPGKGHTIWWGPQLEGVASTSWKIALTAGIYSSFTTWVSVEGGPNGDFCISAT